MDSTDPSDPDFLDLVNELAVDDTLNNKSSNLLHTTNAYLRYFDQKEIVMATGSTVEGTKIRLGEVMGDDDFMLISGIGVIPESCFEYLPWCPAFLYINGENLPPNFRDVPLVEGKYISGSVLKNLDQRVFGILRGLVNIGTTPSVLDDKISIVEQSAVGQEERVFTGVSPESFGLKPVTCDSDQLIDNAKNTWSAIARGTVSPEEKKIMKDSPTRLEYLMGDFCEELKAVAKCSKEDAPLAKQKFIAKAQRNILNKMNQARSEVESEIIPPPIKALEKERTKALVTMIPLFTEIVLNACKRDEDASNEKDAINALTGAFPTDRPDLWNEKDETLVATDSATIQRDLGSKEDLDKSSDVKEYSAETLNLSVADELTNRRENKDMGEVIYIRHASVLGGKSILTLDEPVNCTYKHHMNVHRKDEASVQGDRPHNVTHKGQEVQLDSRISKTETFNTRTRATGEENLGLNTESSEGDDKELFEISTAESPKSLQNHHAFDNAEISAHQMLSSTDFVPAFKCSGWPRPSALWQKRPRLWPSEKVVNEIIHQEFHVVCKAPPTCAVEYENAYTEGKCFRLSFSVAEKILFQNMATSQRMCLRVLKAYQKGMLETNPKTLTSYHWKTTLLWVSENKEPSFWTEKNLLSAVLESLGYMVGYLSEKILPHYFVPEMNLLMGCSDDVCHDQQVQIRCIQENPIISLKKCFNHTRTDGKYVEFSRENIEELRKISQETYGFSAAKRFSEGCAESWTESFNSLKGSILSPVTFHEKFKNSMDIMKPFVGTEKEDLVHASNLSNSRSATLPVDNPSDLQSIQDNDGHRKNDSSKDGDKEIQELQETVNYFATRFSIIFPDNESGSPVSENRSKQAEKQPVDLELD